MDKHAHKMIIAYCFARYEEAAGATIDWTDLIRSGVYELLRRIVISDIKSTIYREIRKHSDVFEKLNNFALSELEPIIASNEIKAEIKDFLFKDDNNDLTSRILSAAHICASYWEFKIVKHANPNSYQNVKIETELLNEISRFNDLIGVRKYVSNQTICNFIDMCGQMRFQVRWAQTPRVPKTSVLGHSMLVASISYFFTRDLPNCEKRIYNNFFGGLFHDLPEAVTRDIISPVKRSSKEFDELLKQIEITMAEEEIYPFLEPEWIEEIKYFTQDEFVNKVIVKHKVKSNKISVDEISAKYNENKFSPMDGELIRMADHLSAFLEAWSSCASGIKSDELIQSAQQIQENYKHKVIGGIPLMQIYSSFRF
ncbi:MAG: HD domain-containing protein [Candidatus Kapabacteria bacterium]|nr:HD domain-containing protein [Candidatus Kapabacteria bacterium]